MNYQWYPGHMTKAKRMMQENIKLIDLVIELLDARAPYASRNPHMDELAKNKARLILLNKSDLADPKKNREWMQHFKSQGIYAVEINSKTGAGIKKMQPMIEEACKEKLERDKRRGIKNRPIRAMVAGIPNVGKSTFINSYTGKACTKTGNKPGVTKGKQWIRLGKNLELLDTPGILWPKFEDQTVGLHLAMIGSLNDENMQMEELAAELFAFLLEAYPAYLQEKGYDTKGSSLELLEETARMRKCYLKGEELDLRKASILLMHEFRSGKLGQITLEIPRTVK